MKKHTAFALFLALLSLCLSSCGSAKTQAPITVNGTPLGEEIFTYFLYEAFGDPAAADKSSRIDEATRDCIRYLAVNTAFASRRLQLAPAERVKVSEETNALWQIFGARWEQAGISKETIYKLRTSHACGEKLRTALFDTNGEKPINEDALRAFFAENYIAVRYVECLPPAGTGTAQTDGERANAAFARLTSAAESINNGAALSEAFEALLSADDVTVKQGLRVALLYGGDPAYPQEFHTACAGIAQGQAVAFTAGESMYLAQRQAPTSDPGWYRMQRATCLRTVSEPYWQEEVNTLCSLYSAVRQTPAVESCYAAVQAARMTGQSP